MSILIDSIMKKAANEGASNVLFMLWAASEIDKMATEHSHLNLPERIHEPSDSALVLEARTGSGFGPPPSKYINHHAYFNSEILNNKL